MNARELINAMKNRESFTVPKAYRAFRPPAIRDDKTIDPNVAQLQQSLADKLGAAVQIDYNKKGQGRLVIRYNSFEELDGILAHIQ